MIDLDPVFLASIRHHAVGDYLRTKRWMRARLEPFRYSIWSSPGETALQVLVPHDPAFDDYLLRMSEVVRDVARFEQRLPSQVVSDFLDVGFDVFRFRGMPTTIAGTIPLEKGVKLIESVKRMIARTSETVTSGQDAKSLMADALLGQTEVGSFVVRAQIPIPGLEGDFLWSDEEVKERTNSAADPVARKVGWKLMSLLREMNSAAEHALATSDLGLLLDMPRRGAGVQFLSAVAEAQETAPEGAFEVEAKWAQARPLTTVDPGMVSMDPGTAPFIRSAVRELRSATEFPGISLQGHIEKLERSAQERMFGDLALRSTWDGRLIKPKLTLQQQDYDRAIEAFKNREEIRVFGNLKKIGQKWHIEDATMEDSGQEDAAEATVTPIDADTER